MDEGPAREIADMIAARLRLPLNIDEADIRQPLTLGGLLQIAFLIAKTARKAIPETQGGFPITDDFLVAMFASTLDPDALRKFFFEALTGTDEDPMHLKALVEGFSAEQMFGECRKHVFDTLNTLWPAPPPGRPSKIEQSDFPSLFERSERLRPLFYDLLELQERFPNRDLLSVLEFLKADYLDEFVYVMKRLPSVQKWIDESRALDRAKTNRARARILADLMAASDYGLGPQFALQKAQEARRYMVGKERNYKPRLKRVEVLQQLKDLHQKTPEFPVSKLS